MHMERKEWAEETAQKIIKKVAACAARSQHKIPYTAKDGVFDDQSKTNIYWWTNGFWGGMMWQMYHATKEELYEKIARENEEKLDAVFLNYETMDHDSGLPCNKGSGSKKQRASGSRKSGRPLQSGGKLFPGMER